MSDSAPRVAIIFADMREARPLVGNWQRVNSSWLPNTAEALQNDNTIAVVGGMGPKHAAAVTRALIEEFSPHLVVSAGFAGAIDGKLNPPAVIRPTRVVNAANGQVYETAREVRMSNVGDRAPAAVENVTLVSSDHVANDKDKRELERRYGATIVDMEAATVADIAHVAGVPFVAVKAISEPADFPMPPFDRFMDDNGRLRTGTFLTWVATRPRYWVPVIQLARNSARAADALAEELRRL